MSMTKAGGVKLRQTMIRKHGSEEAWRKWMSENGRIGGRNGKGHQFAHGMFSPVEAGKIGGAKSRRGSKKKA